MSFSFVALLTILGMVAGTLCMLELGRRLGVRQLARDPEGVANLLSFNKDRYGSLSLPGGDPAAFNR